MAPETILVIGSDLPSRDILTRGAKEIGYSTVVVGSLSDALALSSGAVAESDRSPYNLDLLFRGSERMRAVEDIVRRAADTNVTVLLTGESGGGKEMVARAIHQISGRLDKPFVK